MSVRKSTKTRLINCKYITVNHEKYITWTASRRNCVLLSHADLNHIEQKNDLSKQQEIFTILLGLLPDGNKSYIKQGIPNRVNFFQN